MSISSMVFTESVHWADSVFKSQCPSVCVSVYLQPAEAAAGGPGCRRAGGSGQVAGGAAQARGPG